MRRKIGLNAKKSMYGYLFVTPFVLGFVVFFLSPFLFMAVLSFSKMELTNNGRMLEFIGLDNYKFIFTQNLSYITNVFSSLGALLARLPSVVFFSLIIAIMLSQKFRGRAFYRAVFFLPVVVLSGIGAVAGSGIMDVAQELLIGSSGNDVEATANITESIVNLFGENSSAGAGLVKIIADIISNISYIAQASGVQILIFLAALQTISPSLYEASRIDGATGWENFWKITFPLVSPMILVNCVYTVVDSLAGADNSVISLIYNTAVMKIEYANSAAMSMIYFAVIYAIIGLVVFVISKMVFYEE